jgi:photosystem II stability/assembly factor-like uncharacterized protein
VLAVDPRNTQIAYAAAYDKGIFKTTDGGRTWRAMSSGLPTESISSGLALVVDPRRSQTVYALWGGRLFKTVNGGRRWSASIQQASYQAFALVVDPRNTHCTRPRLATGS